MEWTEAGVFLEFWKRGLLKYDVIKGIDWSWLAMDGAMTKAPLGGEKNQSKPHGYKARRWVVERTHSWLNCFRGILVRWEKKPETYIAMLHLACGIITWRATGLLG